MEHIFYDTVHKKICTFHIIKKCVLFFDYTNHYHMYSKNIERNQVTDE